MTAPRRVVIDDTDPSIQYGANQWFAIDPNELNALGNQGHVWNSSTHSTSTNGATLKFPFNGTSIAVYGTIQTTTDSSSKVDPAWACSVDGITIANGEESSSTAQNNWLLCDQAQLLSGPHTLTVSVQTSSQSFYLDRILYTPISDASYNGAVVEYTAGDPSISYGTGWELYTVENAVENITQATGAQVAINFHGTAVTLTGYVPHELAHNATSATFTVDGGSATTFALPGLSATSNTTLFNTLVLSLNSLEPADHNVVVTYEGDSSKTPLVVQTFYVTNSTTTSSSSSSSTSGPAKSSNAPVATTKHSLTGPIAGGAAGGLAVLALLAGVVFWYRRRRRRRRGSSHPNKEKRSASGKDPAIFSAFTSQYGTSANGLFREHLESGPSSQSLLPAHTPSSPATSLHGHVPEAYDPYTDAATPMPVSPLAPAHLTPYSYPPAPPSSESGQSASSGEPSKAQLAGLAPNRRRIVVQRHQDSGVRLNPTPSMLKPRNRVEADVIEIPPDYSRE